MSPDIIIGTTLGAGSLIGMSYVVSQIAARLFRNPPKLPPVEAYGDWPFVPAEGKWPATPKLSGGMEAAKRSGPRTDDIAHRGEGYAP